MQVNPQIPMSYHADSEASHDHGQVSLSGRTIDATPVFAAYWRFAAERQSIFFRRLSDTQGALTQDPVLQRFKFTNVYRASDRVSQYLIRRVIYREDLPNDVDNVFFRILLFKLFNKIETWEFFESQFGEISWNNFDLESWCGALDSRLKSGTRIYSAAYIMPAAAGPFAHPRKHWTHLKLLSFLMEQRFPYRATKAKSLKGLFELLLSAPSFGPFLAYQYAVDINYSEITDFDEDEFVVAGPGARDGIRKCFGDVGGVSAEQVIRYMADSQEAHFSELGLSFRNLWGRRMRLIDCQNVFCEISKYARVAFPDVLGCNGRTRIKQSFVSGGALPHPWYPPKWALNPALLNPSKA